MDKEEFEELVQKADNNETEICDLNNAMDEVCGRLDDIEERLTLIEEKLSIA